MRARLQARTFTVDDEVVIDTYDHMWEARNITLDVREGLSLLLDTNPYIRRLQCFMRNGQWWALDMRGNEMLMTDPNILAFLKELNDAIQAVVGD